MIGKALAYGRHGWHVVGKSADALPTLGQRWHLVGTPWSGLRRPADVGPTLALGRHPMVWPTSASRHRANVGTWSAPHGRAYVGQPT